MPYVTVEVDVDLSEFSDDDIREEYEERCLGDDNSGPGSLEEKLRLENIHYAMLMGRRDVAYDLMYDYIRDRLGKSI